MKSLNLLFLICILLCEPMYSQIPELIVPQYPQNGTGNVNAITGVSTSSISSNFYVFDQAGNFPEFKHTAQNAWYENGKLVFYVISGVDVNSGNVTLIYNRTGELIDIIYKNAMNEIGIVKVGCTSFHLLIGVTMYYLTLEPCIGKSNLGGAFEMFDLPNAGIPLACYNMHGGAGRTPSTSFAISKPNFYGNSSLNYYTIYYFGLLGGGISYPAIRQVRIYFNKSALPNTTQNFYSYNTDYVEMQFNIVINNPFRYSFFGEMELSPDQSKLAYIDENTVNIYDLNTYAKYTYNSAINYPNNGITFDCQDIYQFQPCGLEFDQYSSQLAITFHDFREYSYWPSGKDAMLIWSSFNVTTPAVTTIIPNSAEFANSFIEKGADNNWYALGISFSGHSGSWGRYLKVDPSGNNAPSTGQFPSSSELNINLIDCQQRSCQNGNSGIQTKNHFRTLPNQIDGLDYSDLNSNLSCCKQYDFELTNSSPFEKFLADYIVNTNTIFENNRVMYKNIIVKSGHYLTIKNCIISFIKDGKIIVEEGAQLIVDNATLTNACDSLWTGIIVMGTSNPTQNITKQGFVHLINNSIIEHAVQAVLVKPNAIIYGVGGSKILNCLNGISFEPSPSVPDSWSFFQDMTFECTNIIPTKTTGTLTFLGINGINLLGVYGCTFINSAPISILPPFQRGVGVDIMNSSVGFHKTHCIFDYGTNCWVQTGNNNRFERLSNGVFAHNSGQSVIIDNSNFLNCQKSIYFAGMGESYIIRSSFELKQNPFQIQVEPQISFIQDFNTNGLHILQNVFKWDNQPQYNFAGIVLNNLGLNSFNNEIRNNSFTQTNRFAHTEIVGIYQGAKYNSLKVELNQFNNLTYGWFLDQFSSVNNQTKCYGNSECPDPNNKWTDAPWSLLRINNLSKSFDYFLNGSNKFTDYDPNWGIISIGANSRTGTGLVASDLIDDCNLPIVDPVFSVNKPYVKGVEIHLSPNPIHEGMLDYRLSNIENINEIMIINTDGIVVYNKTATDLTGKIDINSLNLSPGLYNIQFKTDSEIYNTKFVKQ